MFYIVMASSVLNGEQRNVAPCLYLGSESCRALYEGVKVEGIKPTLVHSSGAYIVQIILEINVVTKGIIASVSLISH